jgi:diguanylate cyclase (GGDEF)-like protein/PAS domain S-box-containing protein
MKNRKGLLSLRQVFLQFILLRLFLTVIIVGLLAVGGIGYYSERELGIHQYQTAKSIARIVDYHLDQGGRILDAIAMVAQNSGRDDLAVFMKSTWQAYRYFETLYYLNGQKEVEFLIPFKPYYVGFDMSNSPVFHKTVGTKSFSYSHPFISVLTGEPTIFLVKAIPKKGYVAGELNLGLFQRKIIKVEDEARKGAIFIMDQSGTLLAYPDVNMVRQQVNLSNLRIFQHSPTKRSNMIYRNNGVPVLGSAALVEKTGWVVVNQIPLSGFWASYAGITGLIFLVSLILGFGLTWVFRKQIQNYVINPLEQLSYSVDALTVGDFSRTDSLSSISKAFAELYQLITNFQLMSANLRIRQNALQASEKRYRGLFNRVPIGLFSITSSGDFIDVNPAVLLILGYPDRETLLRVNFKQLIYQPVPVDKDAPSEEVPIFHGKPQKFETQIWRYDGKVIWIRITNDTPPDDVAQSLPFYEGSIEDINLQKQAEISLRQAKNELELLVERRTKELVALNRELEKMSLRDGLTGIGNRRFFEQFLEQEWQRGMRLGEPVAAIMMDIDYFKNYNDYYGHQAGDDCLKKVAGVLKNIFKSSSDLVARYGGEEFIAILPNTDLNRAVALGEEIRASIESLGIRHNNNSTGNAVTVSLGIAVMVPRQGSPSAALIEVADQALYQAKHEGRNRVSIMDDLN